ncbi:hypothetical protein AABB24_037297 [Solanum stoloniferum]|uniref:Uncharacterized protein n=1 Tax=Solanum stoloniferum TaxID=62892 RepID=A0ABD2R6L0_9SOLN
MSFYIGREASKLWKRICTETGIEINLLSEKWKYILGGLIFQYIHGFAARGVHYLHRPGPTLQDVGFFLLPVCFIGCWFSLSPLSKEMLTHTLPFSLLFF